MDTHLWWVAANGLATLGWIGASIWFVVLVTQKRFSVPWLLASCLLFAVMVVAFIGSALTFPKLAATEPAGSAPVAAASTSAPLALATQPLAAGTTPTGLPTRAPVPPVVPIALPQQPFPDAANVPIAGDRAGAQRRVRGGSIGETPCFRVQIPYDGFSGTGGCKISLATAMFGTNLGPDTPYFEAEGLSDDSPTLDALRQELLDGLARHDARVAASGTPYERQTLARRGPLGTDQGSYLGSRSASIFGRPARILTWGYYGAQDGKANQYVDIIATLPAGRYVWNGKPVTALLIRGYSQGYQPRLFAFALAHFAMN